MEGSSDSKWPRSETSRGLFDSSFPVSDRQRFRSDRTRLSVDPSDKKERDYSGFDRASLGLSGVSVDEKTAEWNNDVSLRQWLDNPERAVDSYECLHIFIQVVEIVNLAHKQGIAVHNVRPSCFVMSSFNRISFIESASCSDSGSDSIDDVTELKGSSSSPLPAAENPNFHFPMKQLLIMESNWYTSPEEANGDSSSCASDIYRLGVILFELFCAFHNAEEKSSTMYSLRHRVLPPQLLLKWPKEASFCLWLLHPDPNNRPKMGELVRSEFLNEPRDTMDERKAAIELREKIEEQDLLLEFLLLLQQRKQEVANGLQDTISFISSDIEEVEKLQTPLSRKGSQQDLGKESSSGLISIDVTEHADSGCSGSRKRCRQPRIQLSNSGEPFNDNSILTRNPKLAKNFKKLEAAYFLTRQRLVKQQQPIGKSASRCSPINSDGRGSIVVSERSSVNDMLPTMRQSGWINSFLEGLCKYLTFDNLKVKADMKQGDLLNSSNLVCSLSFDRDGEFFATAGINKKIKIFEYNAILTEDRDIHYPVVELASRSKLSSICWNSYIKSQIASSNFDGIVQVWDAARSQVFMEMREHEKRVWSVDFSLSDPTMLASGSDDGTVKLWNINQGVSVGTIKTKANVCCVQFPVDSGRTLAFGSADHRIYYYDLRNTKMPLCTLVGHNKTVSYVKFVDSKTLVSSSTDNTLKLWDLSMCTSRVLDNPLHSFTGHTNVKNFVGLSVSEGYIATGSETNEVFIYHKALPMPALSFKFGNAEAAGDEADDAAQFISSVCWRGQSPTLVAANSMGNIKLLEMV